MKPLAGGLLALLVLSLPACLSLFDTRAPAPPAVDTAPLVAGTNRFAFSLYARIRSSPGNLFFSPFSISSALAMTSGGARGKTLEQMQAVIGLPEQAQLHPALAYLSWQLTNRPRGAELHSANALWIHEELRLRPEFLGLMREHYKAGLQPVDFVFDPERARQAINAWVNKQTSERIKDFVPPGLLDASTRLFLCNAITFKGTWQKQFAKTATSQGSFTLADGKTAVQVPMMHQKAELGHVQHGGVQVLELPYAGGDLSMVVLLPDRADGLPALEQALTPENLTAWLAALRAKAVQVSLPRFQLRRGLDLRSTLFHMGMSLAFGPSADLSGMDNGKNGLFLSAAIHQAMVDVHEEGTEAAAATGVAVATLSMDATPRFAADRPFVFLIRDRRTGCILFLGRLIDPRVA